MIKKLVAMLAMGLLLGGVCVGCGSKSDSGDLAEQKESEGRLLSPRERDMLDERRAEQPADAGDTTAE